MNKEIIKIDTDYIKLDQFLKWAGAAESGSHAKEMITDGIVYVNGALIKERGKKIRPGDIVKAEGIGEYECI